ncbi:MAG: hypothetical protein J5680_07350 [Neisseriaceae bacterium]|nr:hypothetical protein [Neisseriaceae bacterium]
MAKAIETLLEFALELIAVLFEIVSCKAIGIFFYVVFALLTVMIAADAQMMLSEAESVAETVFISAKYAILFSVLIALSLLNWITNFQKWEDDEGVVQ